MLLECFLLCHGETLNTIINVIKKFQKFLLKKKIKFIKRPKWEKYVVLPKQIAIHCQPQIN